MEMGVRGGRRIPENLRSGLTNGFRFAKVKMPPCPWPRMDPRIRNLPSTTFCGERLSRHAIAEIQETVQFFPALSRSELVRTACVQMDWHTPGGSPRLGFGLRVLRELQRRGFVQLPPKRGPGRGPQKPLQFDDRTAPRSPLREPLAQLAPVRLETAIEPGQAALRNQWVERYHPQGYRQPIGAHLRYWVRDGRGRLLFDFATRRLPCRDRFIGWQGQAFRERLHLVVRNARYLPVRLGAGRESGLACARAGSAAAAGGLGALAPLAARPAGNLCQPTPAPGGLPGRQLAVGRPHAGPRGPWQGPGQAAQGGLPAAAAPALEAHPAGGPAACLWTRNKDLTLRA